MVGSTEKRVAASRVIASDTRSAGRPETKCGAMTEINTHPGVASITAVEPFTEAIRRLPQVVECHLMAGDCDFLLRVVAKDLEDYRRFQIAHLTRSHGVR